MMLSKIDLIFNFRDGAFITAKPMGSLGGSGKHGRLKIYTHILGYRFKSDSEYAYREPVLLTSTNTNFLKYFYIVAMLFIYKPFIYLYLVFSTATLQLEGSIWLWFYCVCIVIVRTFYIRPLIISRIKVLLRAIYLTTNRISISHAF